jgi:hypothetical protein
MLVDEVVQVIEDFPLTLRQWLHGRALYAKEKRKSTNARASNLWHTYWV